MLSEVGQSQKDKFYMSPLVRGASSSQIHRERKQNMVARVWGEGQSVFKENTTQFCKTKGSVDGRWNGRTTTWMYFLPQNCTHTNG